MKRTAANGQSAKRTVPIGESTKVTLTIGQLRRIVREGTWLPPEAKRRVSKVRGFLERYMKGEPVPCPFCGKIPEMVQLDDYHGRWTVPEECRAGLGTFDTREKAVGAWNRRCLLDLENCDWGFLWWAEKVSKHPFDGHDEAVRALERMEDEKSAWPIKHFNESVDFTPPKSEWKKVLGYLAKGSSFKQVASASKNNELKVKSRYLILKKLGRDEEAACFIPYLMDDMDEYDLPEIPEDFRGEAEKFRAGPKWDWDVANYHITVPEGLKEAQNEILDAVREYNKHHDVKLEFDEEELKYARDGQIYIATYRFGNGLIDFVGAEGRPTMAYWGNESEFMDEFLETLEPTVMEKIDVKQKYPTVPTRDFITVVATPGKSNFTVQAGINHRRIYQNSIPGDQIVSTYFDGMNAVIVGRKKMYVYGPNNPDRPEQSWRLLHSHNAH